MNKSNWILGIFSVLKLEGNLFFFPDDTVSISTTEHFSRLTVPQVKVTDAGNYEISVKNSIGQATAMSTVNVHGNR